jgi:hypothetical protein
MSSAGVRTAWPSLASGVGAPLQTDFGSCFAGSRRRRGLGAEREREPGEPLGGGPIPRWLDRSRGPDRWPPTFDTLRTTPPARRAARQFQTNPGHPTKSTTQRSKRVNFMPKSYASNRRAAYVRWQRDSPNQERPRSRPVRAARRRPRRRDSHGRMDPRNDWLTTVG